MRIKLTSVPIIDLQKAVAFYTEKLGFIKKQDIPMGDTSFITVVSPQEPDGTELLLEPNGNHPETQALKKSLLKAGIPITAFQVDDIQAEHERLKKAGVTFTMPPTEMGPVTQAVFDDTCGNLVQIYQI